MRRAITRLLAIRVMSVAAGVVALTLFLCLSSCHNMDKWDEVPEDINMFVTRYYPGVAYSSFSEIPDGYRVRLRNGPGINFNVACQWVSINGYGLPLPQVFLFDCMPPALYQYLEETDNLNQVFSVMRDAKKYQLETLDSTITYDIESGAIEEKDSTTLSKLLTAKGPSVLLPDMRA